MARHTQRARSARHCLCLPPALRAFLEMNPREGLITDHADSAPLVLPTQAVFVQREGHGLNASVAELVGDLRRVHEQLGGAFAAGTAPKQPKGCVARLAKVLVAAQLRPNLYASELGPQMRVILVGDLYSRPWHNIPVGARWLPASTPARHAADLFRWCGCSAPAAATQRLRRSILRPGKRV